MNNEMFTVVDIMSNVAVCTIVGLFFTINFIALLIYFHNHPPKLHNEKNQN
jgi:hypothetical protein